MDEVINMGEIRPEYLSDIYSELCSIVGIENMLLIYSAFKGQQVSFPQRLFSKEHTVDLILEDYKNGKSIAEISKHFSYSYRWVTKIIRENSDKLNANSKKEQAKTLVSKN